MPVEGTDSEFLTQKFLFVTKVPKPVKNGILRLFPRSFPKRSTIQPEKKCLRKYRTNFGDMEQMFVSH